MKDWHNDNTHSTHLEGTPKLVAHDAVQQGVDASGQEERHARDMGQNHIDQVQRMILGRVIVHRRPVDRQQALRVERRPAQEESHDNCNCNDTN